MGGGNVALPPLARPTMLSSRQRASSTSSATGTQTSSGSRSTAAPLVAALEPLPQPATLVWPALSRQIAGISWLVTSHADSSGGCNMPDFDLPLWFGVLVNDGIPGQCPS